MKQTIFFPLAFLALLSCNSGADKTAATLDSALTSVTAKVESVITDSVLNKSFVANDERFLRFEMVIDRPLKEAWDAFTTVEGIEAWMVPSVRLNLRIGGVSITKYEKDGKDSIPLIILNYIPHEMLTYKVTLNGSFPERCRNEDKNLQEIIQFYSLGPNKTKIVSTMLGWGNGKEWNYTYDFFEKGNKWTYGLLIKRFNSGPVDWEKFK